MTPPEGLVGWLGFWAAFGVIDWLVEPSLSDTTRRTFRTDTLPGRIAWRSALAGGLLILDHHIVHGGK